MSIDTMTPLNIYYCGRQQCKPGHFFGPATRAHYLVHFVIRGKGIYHVNGRIYRIKECQAFLIRPKEITYYKADTKDPWEYVWIAFDGSEADRLLGKYGITEKEYIINYNENGKKYLYQIEDTFAETNSEKLIGLFYLIVSEFVIIKSENKQDYDKKYFELAEEYIRHNYRYDIQVQNIADHVGIDRTYLYKIFMKYLGISTKHYLTDFRIKSAKDMLKYTTLSVTEIALSCGFHDPSIFCRNFQKLEGISPLKFRDRETAI